MFMESADRLKKAILSTDGNTISLKRVYEFISDILEMDSNELVVQNYYTCVKLIECLIAEDVISKRGNRTNGRELYLNYNIKREKIKLSEQDKRLLMSLDKINTGYYTNRPKEFIEDKDILVKINSFLRQSDVGPLSLNERSYEIFSYEKAIKNPVKRTRVQEVLYRIKANESIFRYVDNGTPLLSFVYPEFYIKTSRRILIIENLDTYWSMHRALSNVVHNIDMLIFGQGYSVTSNLKGCLLYDINSRDIINYYGDLDLEGVNIFLKLKASYSDYNIEPDVEFYRLLLDIAKENGAKKSESNEQVMLSKEELAPFLLYFDNEDEQHLITEILLNRKYIPQEAVNYSILVEKLKGGCE